MTDLSQKYLPPATPPTRRVLHISSFLIVGAVALVTWGMQVALAGKVAPNTFALNSNISFQDAEVAQEELSAALEMFEQQSITLQFRSQTYVFSLAGLGITLNKTATIESIPVITASVSPWTVEGGLFSEKVVTTQFEWAPETLFEKLSTQIIDLELPVAEPQITWNAYTEDFEILEGHTGWTPDLTTFEQDLRTHIERLDQNSLEIISIEQMPRLTAEALITQKENLKSKLSQPTVLFTALDEWSIDWLEHLEKLSFDPALAANTRGETVLVDPEKLSSEVGMEEFSPTIRIRLNAEAFQSTLTENIAPNIETASQDVTILMAEDGTISFEGTATDGVSIEKDVLIELIEQALNNGLTQAEIPLKTTPGRVNAPQALRDMGITELVGVGYSAYTGSPVNRKHNIATSIARFDGVLIQPGETFSFGDQLGQVDASTGYRPELVIKEGETIPEYGGGICQVSSTMFRAILFSGLPIVERRPHSYAVTYYAYPMGWGLDATVYPPAVDLKFANDMATTILIQSYVEGNEAYFKFYGTKDGRSVNMDGPYISNRAGAPAPIYIITPDLPAGTIEQKDSAHNGFTATWTRTVTYPTGHPLYPEGTALEETIVSPYRAWPAKYAVGEGTEGYDENGPVAE